MTGMGRFFRRKRFRLARPLEYCRYLKLRCFYTSTLNVRIIRRQGRESEATEAVFCLWEKKPLHTGVRTGCHYLISLSVSVSVCVTFVVFIDCESCTRPIFTNPGSMEAGECGLTRGTCFAARRLELVAVAGRL